MNTQDELVQQDVQHATQYGNEVEDIPRIFEVVLQTTSQIRHFNLLQLVGIVSRIHR